MCQKNLEFANGKEYNVNAGLNLKYKKAKLGNYPIDVVIIGDYCGCVNELLVKIRGSVVFKPACIVASDSGFTSGYLTTTVN